MINKQANRSRTALEKAHELDRQDPLAGFRGRFVIEDPDLIYLDGNSLGRLPKATAALLQDVVNREWGERLIRAWNEGWMERSAAIGDKIGRLLGAAEGEVLVADSTTINLYKLTSAAIEARPGRRKVITDDLNFPSDKYVLQQICERAGEGMELQYLHSADGIHGVAEQLGTAVDGNTALVLLSHTVYASGYTYDLPAVTRQVQEKGALMLWDLSHSAGAVPIDLSTANADLAVGCTYKYLNGGPGAPAYLYVRRDLQGSLRNPIGGWMGHRDIFAFDPQYQPAPDLARFLCGTPSVLSLSAIEPGIDLILEAGMDRVRAKSLAMSDYFIDLWREFLRPLGFELNSPQEGRWRGSHISLGHEEAYRIDLALIQQMNVLPDFRQPNHIRFGLAPLYNSFEDLFQAGRRLARVVKEGLFERVVPPSSAVT